MNTAPSPVDLFAALDERLARYRRLQCRADLARDTRTELRAAIEELKWVRRQLGAEPAAAKPTQLNLV